MLLLMVVQLMPQTPSLMMAQSLTQSLPLVEAQTQPQTQNPVPAQNIALFPGAIQIALIRVQLLLHRCHKAQTSQCLIFAASARDVDHAIQAICTPKDVDLLTIPHPKYYNLEDTFSRSNADRLSLHQPYNHQIVLKKENSPQYARYAAFPKKNTRASANSLTRTRRRSLSTPAHCQFCPLSYLPRNQTETCAHAWITES
jgi:hypothetical protein